MTKVLIVGYGEIGRAIHHLLSRKKGLEIYTWDLKLSLCSHGTDIVQLAKKADFIFLCIPSFAIAECGKKIKKHVRRGAVVISLTKGIERSTALFTSEVMTKTFGKGKIALLAGPMLAEEILANLDTAAMLAARVNNFKKVESLFDKTKLSLRHTKDIRGVSVAGVLKNVYALAIGVADALGLGDNAKGVLMTVALEEMDTLIIRLGGTKRTMLSLAGLGDLEATGNSDHSHNRSLGKKLVLRKNTNLDSEGARSLPLLLKRLDHKNTPPLLFAIKQIVINKKAPRELLERIIAK